jgi:hypothetical protein
MAIDKPISNRALTPERVPRSTASLDELFHFAFTYDGYTEAGSSEACAEIANARHHGTLDDLRTCLFFEQRRWRHLDTEMGEENERYVRGLVMQIAERVSRPRRRERVMSLEQAIAFAALEHKGQVDKVGAAYILHPLRVMLRMHSVPGRRVAVLHDVLEDCGVTPDELRKKGLPEADVEAVVALTRPPGEEYMDFVARAGRNGLARKVKLADLADNMDPDRMALVERDRREALREKYTAAQRLLERLGD